MKYLYCFLCALIVFGCSNNTDCCITINAEFFLKLIDSEGKNLVTEELLPDIRIYYIDENETKQLYYNSNWDRPNSVDIWSNGSENWLVVNPPIVSMKESTIRTIVEWGKTGMLPDTFDVNFNVEGNSIFIDDIIFNDKVVCMQSGCMIEIVK